MCDLGCPLLSCCARFLALGLWTLIRVCGAEDIGNVDSCLTPGLISATHLGGDVIAENFFF